MYKQRLNPKIFQNFKTQSNEISGFMCVLNFPKSQTSLPNCSEIQRYSRIEEASYYKTLTSAAVCIQKHIRRYLSEILLKNLKNQKKTQIQIQSATIIQKHIRRHLATKKVNILRLSKEIKYIRDSAACVIQKFYREKIKIAKLQVLNLAMELQKLRDEAAVYIGKIARGYLVRKELHFIRNKKLQFLIAWGYPARTAAIVGSFTFPPWRLEIPLIYSGYLRIYYSTFFIDNKLQPGEYFYKFIVDGNWVCDGKKPIWLNAEGNYNNFLLIT